MTGFKSEVSQTGLCIYSYHWKNPETILMVKSRLYWYTQMAKLTVKGKVEAVVFMGKK